MRNLILILTLLTAVCCQAQEFTINKGGTAAINYYAEIPYQVIHGLVFIDVEVAGKKHKFLLDTGAPTAISTPLAQQLKALDLGKISLKDAGGRLNDADFVQLDNLKIGGVSFSGIPAMGNVPESLNCLQAEGIIGSNLLRSSIVSIQSDRHVLVLTDLPEKLNLDMNRATPMPTDDRQSLPYITVKLCGGSLTMPFDLGMDRFMTFEQQLIDGMKAHGMGTCFETADQGFGASMIGALGLEPAADKSLVKFPLLQIGETHFENVYAETNKDVMPVIGSHLINYGNVTLDYLHKRFYFDGRAATNDVGEKHWPFEVTAKDGKLVVALIWNKGKEIVQAGEQVLAIDGKDYTHVDFCEAFRKESPLEGKTTVTMVIKDAKGKKRKIKINKE